MRMLLAQINPICGDLSGNQEMILKHIEKAKTEKVDLVIFPELSIVGYPPEDLLLLPEFVQKVEKVLIDICKATHGISVIVGLPRHDPSAPGKKLLNSAAVLEDGKIIGFQDKQLLPTYDVFDERRYFAPGSNESRIWEIGGKRVAITICEDIWQHSSEITKTEYACDPVLSFQKDKPDFLVNLSSSPYQVGKFDLRVQVCQKVAKTLNCPVVFCNQVGGNDSLLFDGYSLVTNASGEVRERGAGFAHDALITDLSEESAPQFTPIDPMEDLHKALVMGIRDYFQKQDFDRACLGLSGGIDSALVASLAVEALGSQNVLALTMPSRFSSEGSFKDAQKLIQNLGIQSRKISIEKPFEAFLRLLSPHFEGKPFDTTEENLQARIRGMILMAFSNKHGYIVLSTGNKSEMAMGYATLYGDLCGGLGVINDITKGQVYELAKWINRDREIIPKATLDKPPSAELRADQKDSDSLPDYAIVDVVLEDYVEGHFSSQEIAKKHQLDEDLVLELIRKIHQNEYKRRQGPLGLRVSSKAFSVGRRFPIVQKWV